MLLGLPAELDEMNGLAVESKGKSGGLWMLWSRSLDLKIQTFSSHHIEACITATATEMEMYRFLRRPRRLEAQGILGTSEETVPFICTPTLSFWRFQRNSLRK
uniref:Uncharacterized protein n=1 Tax=Utricularia reniformis TaxID=192314 RepID=A0A1Y0B144_9LAMI|nr:hypothetical protein AEK19_MT0938 [Utricularia reniformis]ART31162.1 hypothetical protein AEK19_MT0938 [Utricularia reniformis]